MQAHIVLDVDVPLYPNSLIPQMDLTNLIMICEGVCQVLHTFVTFDKLSTHLDLF
jgi:hypothetical protein